MWFRYATIASRGPPPITNKDKEYPGFHSGTKVECIFVFHFYSVAHMTPFICWLPCLKQNKLMTFYYMVSQAVEPQGWSTASSLNFLVMNQPSYFQMLCGEWHRWFISFLRPLFPSHKVSSFTSLMIILLPSKFTLCLTPYLTPAELPPYYMLQQSPSDKTVFHYQAMALCLPI